MARKEDGHAGPGDGYHHRKVELPGLFGNTHTVRQESGREPQDTQEIEDIASHDIAYRNISLSTDRGHDRSAERIGSERNLTFACSRLERPGMPVGILEWTT